MNLDRETASEGVGYLVVGFASWGGLEFGSALASVAGRQGMQRAAIGGLLFVLVTLAVGGLLVAVGDRLIDRAETRGERA